MNKTLLEVAGGSRPADMVVKNGKIVNVFSGEIHDGGIAICKNRIAAIGEVDYTIGRNTMIVDAEGKFLTPGFIDGHIHPESSSLSISSFAAGVLKHGTTSIMTDLHEVGVVSGLQGIEAVLEEAKATDLKVFFIVPSHVPFSPNLETSGGKFDPQIIRKALSRPDAVGLSECVGPYILARYPELMESIDDARAMGKSIQGHLPEMEGKDMNCCLAAGVSTDHEGLWPHDAVERLRNGCHLMMREGSAARNLNDLLKAVLDGKLDTSRCSIVTDDLHTIDLAKRGHLDDSVRTALKAGASFVNVIQMVTLNAARAFGLDNEIGGLAPGRRADVNITTGPDDFNVESVIADGKLVLDKGRILVHYPDAVHASCLLNTCRLLRPITPDSFKTYAPSGARKVKVRVMDTLPFIPITTGREVELFVEDGVVKCDLDQDVLYIAQVERYGKNGNIGKAFMGGFNLKEGAIASSVGHDNHNIIVLGTNFEDMALAVNRCVELSGGQVVARNGKIASEIAYPICGLLCDMSADDLAAKKTDMISLIHQMGCKITIPFMFLSFICLAAIPQYAITDHGFIDAIAQKVINPIICVVE
jgi:adenine deaminase